MTSLRGIPFLCVHFTWRVSGLYFVLVLKVNCFGLKVLVLKNCMRVYVSTTA